MAPTLVSYQEVTSFTAVGSPKSVASIAVQTGDLIVVCAIVEDSAYTFGTPSDGTNTYTSRVAANATSWCRAQIWTATAAGNATLTVQNTLSNSTKEWGFGVSVWRGHNSFGNTGSQSTGDPANCSITTAAAGSAILWACGDWNAVDGSAATMRQVNGSNPTQRHYARNSSTYTSYVETHADAGTAAAKAVGWTAPTGTRPTVVAIEIKAAAGASVTGTATCLITASTPVVGKRLVAGTTAQSFGGTYTAVGTPKVLGQATLTEVVTSPVVGIRTRLGQLTGGATFGSSAVGTRKAFGALTASVSFTSTAVGTPTVKGTLTRLTTFSSLAYVSSPLQRTLHKSLGHAPSSISDYVTAFSPNTASGGWHRGDGGQSIMGTGWQLFVFNDFFISNGSGGVGALPTQNSILEVRSDGDVYWLSGGNGGAAGSRTFPDMIGGRTVWLKGGWATSSTSAIILAGTYASGTLIGHQVMEINGVGTSAPWHSSINVANIPLASGTQWGSQPYVHSGYVYLYGINVGALEQRAVRHVLATTAGDYADPWEVWTGSAWVAGGTEGAISIGTGPLSQLNLVAANPDYSVLLASSKVFNTAPELDIPDTWPEIRGWSASAPEGPWTYRGVFWQPTTRTNWYSYAGRIDRFLGVDRLVAMWSLNAETVDFDPDIYGPQLADPRNQLSGDATGLVSFTSPAVGKPTSTGTLTASISFTSAAVGTPKVSGALATSVTFGSSAVGTPNVRGLATGSFGFTSPASGSTAGSVAGTASGSFVFNGSSTGTVRSYGVTSATIAFTASASGHPTSTGTASLALSWTGSAAGTPRAYGSATALLSFSGAASGTGTTQGGGTATGAFAFTSSAAGTPTSRGTATASISFTAPAAGIIPRTGSATCSISFSSAAAGTGSRGGSATASITFGASALGRPTVRATASGALSFTGSAEGDRSVSGSASGALVFSGTASGSAYVPAEGLGGLVYGREPAQAGAVASASGSAMPGVIA